VPYSAAPSSSGPASTPAINNSQPPAGPMPQETPPAPTGSAPAGAAPGAESPAGGETAGVISNSTVLAAGAALKAAAASPGLPITAVPATVASNAAPASEPATGGAAAPAAGRSALTLEGPSAARVGEEFRVTVHLATDQSITRMRSQLRYDSAALQLVSADPGDMVPAAAGSPKVDTRGSGAQLDVTTTSDEPVQGNGSLMVLQFKALAARPATDILAMLNVLGGAGAAVGNSSAPPLKIAIQP